MFIAPMQNRAANAMAVKIVSKRSAGFVFIG
jgi:hypothetical protein